MKPLALLICTLVSIQLNAQTSYTSLPASGVYTNSVSTDVQGIDCNYKYYGENMIKLRVDITGNKIIFMVSKVTSGATFNENTEIYIKESSSNDYPTLVCSKDYYTCLGTSALKYFEYDASSFKNGTRYFCATTYNANSERYYSSKISITATTSTPIDCNIDATAFEGNDIKYNSFVANWNSNAGVTSYSINVKKAIDIDYSTALKYTSNTNNVIVTGLEPCTEYKFQVKSNCGNWSPSSEVIKTISSSSLISITSPLTGNFQNGKNVIVKWQSNYSTPLNDIVLQFVPTNHTPITIASGLNSSSPSYSWTIGSDIPSTSGVLKVYSTSNTCINNNLQTNNQINIISVTPNTNLVISKCMGFSSYEEYSNCSFTTSIQNLGTSDWVGSFFLKADGINEPILSIYNKTIKAGVVEPLQGDITMPTNGNYNLTLYYQTNNTGNGIAVPVINCLNNPKPITITKAYSKKTDGFDYPIGDKGINSDNYPYELSEHINPEKNNISIYNSYILAQRSGNVSGWYNISDVGNFVSTKYASYAGLHPAEDWNLSGGDLNEPIYCVANGIVKEIKTVSGTASNAGWVVKIEHTLPDNSKIYSLYFHVTTANSTDGSICTSVNDFSIATGDYIKRGQMIARIGNTSSFSSHLHFEIRDRYTNLYPNGQANGYYTNAKSTSWNTYNSSSQISKQEIIDAIKLMKFDGIYDPSDFIDANRPGNINNGLDICGGDVANPKKIKIWFTAPDLSSSFIVSNLKIGTNSISASKTLGHNYNSTTGKGEFCINITSSDISGFINNSSSYGIEFTINDTYIFKGKNQVYFVNPSKFIKPTGDIIQNYWGVEYINDVITNGIMRGNINDFTPDTKITRAQAAKVIVNAALQLKRNLYREINISTNDYGAFSDVSSSEWYFPFVQTLRNWNKSDGTACITRDDSFNPDSFITIGQLSKIICNVFDINVDNRNGSFLQADQRDVYLTCNTKTNDASIINSIENLRNIFINRPYPQRLITSFGAVNNYFSTDIMNINCDSLITRAIMAKVISNVSLFATGDGYTKYTCSLNSCQAISPIVDVSGYTIIGDLYEVNSNFSSSIPDTPSIFNETIQSGSEKEFGNVTPIKYYYYWACDNGKIVDLTSDGTHSRIRYKAPIVTQKDSAHIYAVIGNAAGQIIYAKINIRIEPQATQNIYNISAKTNITDAGIINGSGNYTAGSTVKLIAQPYNGYKFTSWLENNSVVSTDSIYTFTASSNRNIIGNFSLLPPIQYTLTLSTNISEAGTVTGGGSFIKDSSATLVATPNIGYTFLNWTENGAIISTHPQSNISISCNRKITANFILNNSGKLISWIKQIDTLSIYSSFNVQTLIDEYLVCPFKDNYDTCNKYIINSLLFTNLYKQIIISDTSILKQNDFDFNILNPGIISIKHELVKDSLIFVIEPYFILWPLKRHQFATNYPFRVKSLTNNYFNILKDTTIKEKNTLLQYRFSDQRNLCPPSNRINIEYIGNSFIQELPLNDLINNFKLPSNGKWIANDTLFSNINLQIGRITLNYLNDLGINIFSIEYLISLNSIYIERVSSLIEGNYSIRINDTTYTSNTCWRTEDHSEIRYLYTFDTYKDKFIRTSITINEKRFVNTRINITYYRSKSFSGELELLNSEFSGNLCKEISETSIINNNCENLYNNKYIKDCNFKIFVSGTFNLVDPIISIIRFKRD